MWRGGAAAVVAGALGALAAGCSLLTSWDGYVCSGDCTDASSGPPPIDAAPFDAARDGAGGVEAGYDARLDSPPDTFVAPPVDSGVDASDAGVDASVPITFVQGNSSHPSTAAATLAFNTPVAAGDAILVAFFCGSAATLSSVTDSLGNTFQTVVGPDPGSNNNHYIAIAPGSAAGADSVTVTLSAAPAGFNLFILEYAGLAPASAFDVTSTGSDTAADTDGGMASGFATTTAANELIFGLADSVGGAAGAGFTLRFPQAGNFVEDQVVSSAGSYEATGTATSGSWTLVMATFIGQ